MMRNCVTARHSTFCKVPLFAPRIGNLPESGLRFVTALRGCWRHGCTQAQSIAQEAVKRRGSSPRGKLAWVSMVPARDTHRTEIRVAGGRAVRREARNRMALMSQRQYAAHRGVARSAVQRAINDGRIPTAPDGRIDAGLADAEWGAQRHRARGRRRQVAAGANHLHGVEGKAGRHAGQETFRRSTAGCGGEDCRLQRIQAHPRRLHEHSHALLRGGRRPRSAPPIEETGMPGEMVANMSARLNLAAMETILSGEIRMVLNVLSDSFEQEKSADESETSKNG